jgi:hypothetical protein
MDEDPSQTLSSKTSLSSLLSSADGLMIDAFQREDIHLQVGFGLHFLG